MKSLTFLLVTTLFFLSTATQAKTISSVAAVVNDEVISTYQLDQAFQQALAGNKDRNQLSSTQIDNLKVSLLEKLINDKLIKQRTRELQLSVSESELSTAIRDVQAKNNLSNDQLEKALNAQGMTMKSYRGKIKDEILRYKLLSREVNYKVLVTSGEVRDYFREHIDEYRVEPRVRVSRISFPIPPETPEEQFNELLDQVNAARDRLNNGDEFDAVLEAYENANGGDMGEMEEKDLASSLREAIVGLNEGDVSEIIRLNDQLHLFFITFRNPGDSTLFDRVKGGIENKLRQEKTEARMKEWQQELRTNAYIEKRI